MHLEATILGFMGFFTPHAWTHLRGIFSVWIPWRTGSPPSSGSGVGMAWKSDIIPVPLKVSQRMQIGGK